MGQRRPVVHSHLSHFGWTAAGVAAGRSLYLGHRLTPDGSALALICFFFDKPASWSVQGVVPADAGE
jgi:hypothetical protein